MRGLACLIAAPDDLFTRTLELELSAHFDAVRLLAVGEPVPPCALLVLDLDYDRTRREEAHIAFTRGPGDGARILHRPFRMADLRALLSEGEGSPYLIPDETFRTVTVGGEVVRLSECEGRILRILFEANGAEVEREALAVAVFPTAANPEDTLRVYIHYLRKKLERNRKRLILARRGGGYSLLLT